MFGEKRQMSYCPPECETIVVRLEGMIAASNLDPKFEKPFDDEEEL